MRELTRRRLLLSLGGLGLVVCTRAPVSGAAPSGARPASALAANARLGVWPQLVVGAQSQVRTAYEYAARLPASLTYIPCYCGCGASGHRDNLGCYVERSADDGWVVLDPHAAACGVCVGITLDVIAMEKEGRPLAAIRRTIDARWSAAGPGTPTRLP